MQRTPQPDFNPYYVRDIYITGDTEKMTLFNAVTADCNKNSINYDNTYVLSEDLDAGDLNDGVGGKRYYFCQTTSEKDVISDNANPSV